MTQKEYRCRTCGATFDNGVEMERHRRTTHSEYKCEACGQIFHSEHELKTHDRIAHPEDAPVR